MIGFRFFFFFSLITGIRLHIFGQAKTNWHESETKFVDGKQQTKDIFYQANEVYLDAKTFLQYGENGKHINEDIHKYKQYIHTM